MRIHSSFEEAYVWEEDTKCVGACVWYTEKITSAFLIRKTLLPYKEDTARVLHVGVMKLTGGEKTLVSSL